MKQILKNIISIYLLLLILFSTVGFNIITTFCDDCNDEHVRVSITSTEDPACRCCSDSNIEGHCCKSFADDTEKHHKTNSIFAQLKFDSQEAKSNLKVLPAVFTIEFTCIIFKILYAKNDLEKKSPLNPPFILAGKLLLTHICILKN